MALPGDKSPASIALRVIETHKPPNRDKVAPPGENFINNKGYISLSSALSSDNIHTMVIRKDSLTMTFDVFVYLCMRFTLSVCAYVNVETHTHK